MKANRINSWFKIACSLWCVGFVYFLILFFQPNLTVEEEKQRSISSSLVKRKKGSLDKKVSYPLSSKKSSSRLFSIAKIQPHPMSRIEMIQKWLKKIKSVKKLKKPLKNSDAWFSYYGDLFRKNSSQLGKKIFETAKTKQEYDFINSELCKKGYLQFCLNFHRLFYESEGLEGKEKQETIDEGYEYAMMSCEGYSYQSCSTLSNEAHRLTEKQLQEFSKTVTKMCEKGWSEACLSLSELYREQGREEEALSLAEEICHKTGNCHIAGFLLTEKNPKISEKYLYRSCLHNAEKCTFLIVHFPQSLYLEKAIQRMEGTCRQIRVFFTACRDLASYYNHLGQGARSSELLTINCEAGNGMSCKYLAQLHYIAGDLNEVLSIGRFFCSRKGKESSNNYFSKQACDDFLDGNQEITKSTIEELSFFDLNKDDYWREK